MVGHYVINYNIAYKIKTARYFVLKFSDQNMYEVLSEFTLMASKLITNIQNIYLCINYDYIKDDILEKRKLM